jgi:hypothetical protein
MSFELPGDLQFNRGMIVDPEHYLEEVGCVSWLFLVGEEFAGMPGGMSYEQVEHATPHSRNVISDPPRVLDLEIAKKQIEALDILPRPTLISCRTGPRASAAAYLYAGLKQGADPEEVIEAAERDQAPFVSNEDYKAWVVSTLEALRKPE